MPYGKISDLLFADGSDQVNGRCKMAKNLSREPFTPTCVNPPDERIRRDSAIAAAVAIGIVLFMTSVWIHLEFLAAARRIATSGRSDSLRLSISYLVVLGSHLLIAGLFALGFTAANEFGLGGFKKEIIDSWMDVYYFSLINITTLGLGDIYPTGHLRAITGIESLTGFLLISFTAQFVYKTMKNQEN